MWIKIVQEPSTKEKEWSQMSIMRPEFFFVLYDSVWKQLKGIFVHSWLYGCIFMWKLENTKN